jgi:uncharacterized membrane protein YccC
MSDSATAVRPASWLRPRNQSGGAGPHYPWLPVWSRPAAIRAARATVVVPALFAISLKVIGNPQMTLFAVFGGFASLILASFGGTRRDKAVAHLGLAIVGSVALTIGTLVSGTTWLAVVVTIPVAFAIFFSGVAGPNAASGVTAALLIYVLPVASAAPASAIGWRLAGWGLASAAATAAVLLVSPPSPGDKLRASAAASARALAAQLAKSVSGTATPADRDAAVAAKHQLITVFGAGPLRPTGLTTTDQGLANVAELLEWCTALIADSLDERQDLSQVAPPDVELFSAAADILDVLAALLSGQDVVPNLDRLESARLASAAHQRTVTGNPDQLRAAAAHAAHAQEIAVAVRAAVADSLIATRRADPELIATERRRWYGRPDAPARRLPALTAGAGFLARHASIRSVWFRSSLRGAVALAAAVAVADVSGVQHGFWVVLGTLSVLRTTAAATGATALRALAGTAVGFVIGAALLLGIGTDPAVLWVVLPVAVLIAAYAPGTLPFAAGQAAFTVTVVVIFNLLVPAGWQVGLLRIEDVAIGCAVSVVVGIVFWPRGASSIVADDLADAFRGGSRYLSQAVDWAFGLRASPPDTAVAAVTASIRLDEALRSYLAEQGTKRLPKQELWGLVMGTIRLRLTAYAVASLHDLHSPQDGHPPQDPAGPPDLAGPPGLTARPELDSPREPASPAILDARARPAAGGRAEFLHLTTELTDFYDRVADQLAGRRPGDLAPVAVPPLTGPALPVGVACGGNTPPYYKPDMLWVGEYLYHLGVHAGAVSGPAAEIAGLRHRPWWR